ncbi:Arc-like DNA binding domain-containing protein [Amycolatopsis marina]|uniref:Arc-like DNA binding domain-containing protein n=1 Tax=Amycolatopsis marina TaxID=490629 RepID=A0A1I1BHE6_9PSEU|nr:Arc family DNA-binding protein [Amycolatopsis marina]SFB49789.1 Arc-like DNA binding domain-containing protein [Amycolatopsis marina]
MDLTSYVDFLGRELATAAEAGGEEARALAERLTRPIESAVRLTLLEALSAAADEITRDLAPGSVEVRLRGRDPNFVVTPPPSEPAYVTAAPEPEPAMDPGPAGAEEAATARINFRLPEQLKASIEEAAAKEGRSVNAWLGRVASAALRQPGKEQASAQRGGRGKQRYTGWVS